MSSYDSRVQLTSKSSVIYKFLVHADSPQGKSQSPKSSEKAGRF